MWAGQLPEWAAELITGSVCVETVEISVKMLLVSKK